MWSPKLDPVRREYPTLAPLLDRVVLYIQRQLDNNQKFIIPKLVAAELKLSDGEAYVLLETLARAGILERAFNVYCRENDTLLTTVDREDKLDNIPDCDDCNGVQHELNDLRLEIAFRPKGSANGLTKAA